MDEGDGGVVSHKSIGAAMPSSPWEGFWRGDGDVASPPGRIGDALIALGGPYFLSART